MVGSQPSYESNSLPETINFIIYQWKSRNRSCLSHVAMSEVVILKH